MDSVNKPHIRRSRTLIPPPSDTHNQSEERTPSQNETTRQDTQVLLPHQIRSRASRLPLENEQLQTIHPIDETQFKPADIKKIEQPAAPLEERDISPFELLPWEILEHIGQFLDFKSAVNLHATCKTFRQYNTFLKLSLDQYFYGKSNDEREALREMGREKHETISLTANLKHLKNLLDKDNPIRSAALFSILADYKALPFHFYLKKMKPPEDDNHGVFFEVTLITNEQVATSYNDGTVSIWDLNAPNERSLVKSLSGHTKAVIHIIQLKNGWLVTGSRDNTLRVWNLNQAPENACITILKIHEKRFSRVTELPNLRIVSFSGPKLTTQDTGILDIWDIKNLPGNTHVKTIDINSTNQFRITDILAVSETQIATIKTSLDPSQSTIAVLNLSKISAEFEWTFTVEGVNVESARILKDKRIIAGVSKNIYLWDHSNLPDQLHTMKGHTGRVRVITELKNDLVASGSSHFTVKLWDLNQLGCPCIATLKGHIAPIMHISQLSNEWVISICGHGNVRVWDISEPSEQSCFALKDQRDKEEIMGLIIHSGCSPDGKVIFEYNYSRGFLDVWNLYKPTVT